MLTFVYHPERPHAAYAAAAGCADDWVVLLSSRAMWASRTWYPDARRVLEESPSLVVLYPMMGPLRIPLLHEDDTPEAADVAVHRAYAAEKRKREHRLRTLTARPIMAPAVIVKRDAFARAEGSLTRVAGRAAASSWLYVFAVDD